MVKPGVPATTRPETDEETALREATAKWELESPERLDASARQVITLVTALYSVLFGVLAVAGDPLPVYLTWPLVRWLGAVAVVGLGSASVAALVAVVAWRYTLSGANLTEQRAQFYAMLHHKSNWLRLALGLFGVGVLALALLLLVVVMFVR